MPQITHTVRASIGGIQEAAPTRTTLTVPTGMNAPSLNGGNSVPSPAKTGQPDTTEGTTAAVTLSPQLTAIARKQQKLQSDIQAQRDREAQWEKEKAGYISKDALKAKFQEDPDEAIKMAFDMGYDALANAMLAKMQGADPVQQLQQRLDSIEKSQHESTNKLFDQTVAQYRTEASKMIASDEKYVMLKDEPEAAKAAIDELLEDFEKTGETKDISYYLDLAEDGLKEMAQSLSARLEKTKKPEPEVTAPAKKTLPPPGQAPRTLTQQVATTPTRVPNQFQHLSPKERLAQALARVQRA